MVVGVVLLVGSGIYYMANMKTPAELRIAQLGIEIDNNRKEVDRLGGRDSGLPEYRTAQEINQQALQKAYWPAGLGGLFLVLGWVVQGAQGKKASEPEPQDSR